MFNEERRMKRHPRHMGPLIHHMRRRPIPGMGFPRRFFMDINEIESKDDAIDMLEIRVKGLEKRKRKLMKEMDRMEALEEILERSIKEVAKMKEYSTDELKSIIKKMDKNITARMFDEEFD